MAATADWRANTDWNRAVPRSSRTPEPLTRDPDKLVRPDAICGVIRPHEPRGRGRALRSEFVRRDWRPGLPPHYVIVGAWRQRVTAVRLVPGSWGPVRGIPVFHVVCARRKEHPTNEQVKLLRVRNKFHVSQGLVLPGRLHDELAVAEQPPCEGPFEAHVRDLAQRHHVDLPGQESPGEQESLAGDHEIVN